RTGQRVFRIESLVSIVVAFALLGRAAKLVEGAVRTPGFRIETVGARHGQHVAMTAAFWTLVRWSAPPTRLEPEHGRGLGLSFGGYRHIWGNGYVGHPLLILDERRRTFLAAPAPAAPRERRA